MNPDDHRNRLVDMLLHEVVGGEPPVDVLERVLKEVEEPGEKPVFRTAPLRRNAPMMPLPRSSRFSLSKVAALFVLLAIPLGVLYHFHGIAKGRTPVIVSAMGRVSPDSGVLANGETLVTGDLSTAVLVYPDGTRVVVGPDTTLEVPEQPFTDRALELVLTVGAVEAEVAAQPAEYPMAINSEHGNAVVVGTKLSFQKNAERARLEVIKGEVRLEPESNHEPVLVIAGEFAEASRSEAPKTGLIDPPEVNRVLGFTLMNAETDEPIGDEVLTEGQTISLSSLPTKQISLRVELAGKKPFSVQLSVFREDGKDTDLKPLPPQHHPPYYVTGDHSGSKRSGYARPWTPPPGPYEIIAEPKYRENGEFVRGESFSLNLVFQD